MNAFDATQAFEITWPDAAYVDVLPFSLFVVDGVSDSVHDIRGPQGGISQAYFSCEVEGARAVLDYSVDRFKRINQKNDLHIGKAILTFSDPSRTDIRSVIWDDGIKQEGGATAAVVALSSVAMPNTVAADVLVALQVVRPAQANFRAMLLRAYASTCCISGCTVPDALDAAHVQAFADQPTNVNDVRNGLLLRADLHRLLDSHLLGIDPGSKRVFFAASVRHWPEYGHLHGKGTLRKPAPGFEGNSPDGHRLARQWAAFQAKAK